MTRSNQTFAPGASASGAADAPSSVADILLGGAKMAIAESIGEVSRAQDKRGTVYLTLELCLGDGGEPMWLKSDVHFERMRHYKDRARSSNVG